MHIQHATIYHSGHTEPIRQHYIFLSGDSLVYKLHIALMPLFFPLLFGRANTLGRRINFCQRFFSLNTIATPSIESGLNIILSFASPFPYSVSGLVAQSSPMYTSHYVGGVPHM